MMITLTPKQLNKCQGIIVWDFDGVLFDTERLKQDFEEIFRQKNIDLQAVMKGSLHIKYIGRPFSLSFFLRTLKENGHSVSELFVRRKYQTLLQNEYLDPQADRILRFLRRKGYLLTLLSFGVPSFQYPKIKIGCGKNFMRHFIKIRVTKNPKFMFIKNIHRKFPQLPIYFIDDTSEHITLVKKHIPFVKTIHFTSSHTLPKVAKYIVSHAKN